MSVRLYIKTICSCDGCPNYVRDSVTYICVELNKEISELTFDEDHTWDVAEECPLESLEKYIDKNIEMLKRNGG